MTLRVHEIFESISGEAGGFPQGTWITGVRLQGCNLRCSWCDTERAQGDGPCTEMSIPTIVEHCRNKHVLITGGEPLFQMDDVVQLISKLHEAGHDVQVETNGSLTIPSVDCIYPIHWVVDYKCPSSGMTSKMPPIPDFTEQLNRAMVQGDMVYVKWVVADETDLKFAIECIVEMEKRAGTLNRRFPSSVDMHIISPLDGNGHRIPDMAKVIRESHAHLLDRVVFSVQLHKLFRMP